MRRSSVIVAVLAALACAATASAQDGYKIIVNPSNPATALTKAQISAIFLRRTVAWEDGRPVAPVDQNDPSVREAFAREVLGMPVSAAVAQAQQAAASGRGEAPVAVASDREVLAFVRLKPGAICYVSAGATISGVKVVSLGRSGEKGDALEPLLVGGSVKTPLKLVDARPTYPDLARQTRTQGMVEVEIVVGTTGEVEHARVTKSIPVLDRAALDAVRKWKYAPTIVNGVAVPVKMTVGLAFGL
jgi:TonB family protein